MARHTALRCWLWLGEAAGATPAPTPTRTKQLLQKIVAAVKNHPGLGAYKGIDEPAQSLPSAPGRPEGHEGALRPVKRSTLGTRSCHARADLSAADLKPVRPAFDITGADIYPISYPPGTHAQTANKDISVVATSRRS